MLSKYNCGSVFIHRKIHINLSVRIGPNILHAISGFAHLCNNCLYSEFFRQVYHRIINVVGSVGHAGKRTVCCFHTAAGNGNRAGGTANSTSDIALCTSSGCRYRSPAYADIISVPAISTADSSSTVTPGRCYDSFGYRNIASDSVITTADSRSSITSGCRYLSSAYGNITSTPPETAADSRSI